jgi:hypothetical protein
MVNDIFGIKLLYPSSESNEQYVAVPQKTSEIQNNDVFGSRISNVKGTISAFTAPDGTIGFFEYEPDDGNDVKMEFLPSSLSANEGEVEIALDCDLNHEETTSQGYVNDSAEWKNVEIQSHFFVKAVDSPKGYLFFEARNGYSGDKGGCCQGTAYGVRLFWDNATADKGTFAFYKQEFTNSLVDLPKQTQTRIPTFYQKWFAVKFVIYNVPPNFDRVKLELWLSPTELGYPAHPYSNQWAKVGEAEDYVGRDWTSGGDECDAVEDDAPITWAAPFCSFGWQDGKVIQFMYTSAREIDPEGSFGEDPEPNPNPDPGQGVPNPDPTPPEIPPTPPTDAEPPLTPTTMTKRLTLRREVVNNRLCSCDGTQTTVPPGGGGGGGTGGGGTGGGGGGTNTFITLYNVPLDSTASFASLAKVTGSSTFYLRFGQGVTQTSSNWINKSINRVEITIADQGNPTGGTGGGVNCVIRKASDDSIAATLSPVATETDILNTGKVFVFENLTNTYKMAFNDKLLFEYDGGNSTNFVKIFRREQPTTTGTKIVWQANDQDAGEYRNAPSLDCCMRVYTLTP